MIIKIRYFAEDLPKLKNVQIGDWIDLYSAERVVLVPGDFRLIPLGVAMQLPPGYEALIVPRSSSFKNFGIIQTNSVGIIDESYCGTDDQWMMPVYATRNAIIEKGDRICQFRIIEHQPAVGFVETETLCERNRGGFGSTGIS